MSSLICAMAKSRYVLAVGLAAATLALVVINAIGNVAVVLKVGPTPVLSLAAIGLATAAFVMSWKQRSFLVVGIFVASAFFFMWPALTAMDYSFAVIVFHGSLLGVVFGILIFGLRLVRGIRP